MNTPNKKAELEKEIEKLNNDVKLQQTKLFFLLNSSDNIITDLPMSEAFKFWWFMECKAELKGIKEGKAQAISEFKENMLMTKTNHQLGCMLECYQSVIENRIGFEKEAKQLLEIASKLK